MLEPGQFKRLQLQATCAAAPEMNGEAAVGGLGRGREAGLGGLPRAQHPDLVRRKLLSGAIEVEHKDPPLDARLSDLHAAYGPGIPLAGDPGRRRQLMPGAGRRSQYDVRVRAGLGDLALKLISE